MRVLSSLLLLGCSLLGVSSQYVTDATSSFSNGWRFTGALTGVANPPLNFIAGNTYTFDISASQASHPFNFSKDTTSGSPAVTSLDANFYTVSTNANCGTSGNGFNGNGCIVSLTINPNAPNATIFYKCTVHAPMTGNINIAAAATGNTTVTPTTATPTTSGATTATPTTATPTTGGATTATPTTATPTTPAPTTGGTIVGNSFHITGASATTAYIFTDNGVQYLNPTLTVTAGTPVTISIDFQNFIHPFGFSNNNSPNSVSQTQAFFPDSLNTYTVNNATVCDFRASSAVHIVTANVTGTPCVLTIPTLASDAGTTLYYRCAYHPAMIGTINVAASGTGSSSSSSTGGNKPGTASTLTGAGLALVVALMAAMMA